ncbi:hypothetical protein [Streptosporangium sp. NPDC049644]|uniref:hypothetical protein n=1 Tax=Streptosporangium sp. NPDC049644 TaxID=3155507 RepID=UPI0034403B28
MPTNTRPLLGNATNINVPYTFRVASFVSGGSSSCTIWNQDGNATASQVTWSCNAGSSFLDEDGFTFTNVPTGGYYVRFNTPSQPSAPYHWVTNGKYTRIHDYNSAACRWESGVERYDAYCTVT